jgi:hypothetical protein
MKKESNEIYLGGGSNMIMATSKLVTCYETLTLVVNGRGGIPLDIKIEADFSTIPEEYHEVFLNMMAAKYMKAVSFGDNPFSKCIPQPKKKWYQFWKASVNI